MAQNNNILSITELMNRNLAPIVASGKYENCTIKDAVIYPVTATNKTEFVRFTFKLEDGREISDNRFAQGLNIMISHLREQLNLQDVEVNTADLLAPGKHKFTIWVERNVSTVNNMGQTIRVTNIHFLEPLKTQKEEPAVEEIKNDELPDM